jgi:hypothetical protein
MKSYKRIGENTLEVIDNNGNSRIYSQVIKDLNGNPMTDNLVDGDNYIKYEFSFFKKGDIIAAVIPDPTFSNNTFDI